jgi:hypothetical protein
LNRFEHIFKTYYLTQRSLRCGMACNLLYKHPC